MLCDINTICDLFPIGADNNMIISYIKCTVSTTDNFIK